jgi:hypothetical protein
MKDIGTPMDDPLQTTHPHPLDRTFVVKLHRDARLENGELRGRLLHVVSDERVDFASAGELASALTDLVSASLSCIGEPPSISARR